MWEQRELSLVQQVADGEKAVQRAAIMEAEIATMKADLRLREQVQRLYLCARPDAVCVCVGCFHVFVCVSRPVCGRFVSVWARVCGSECAPVCGVGSGGRVRQRA